MSQKVKALIISFILLSVILIQGSEVQSTASNGRYWAIKVHDHNIVSEIGKYTYSFISKARVQVVEFRENYSYDTIPSHLKQYLRPFNPDSLVAYENNYSTSSHISQFFSRMKAKAEIKEVLKSITPDSFYNRVKSITDFGPRTNTKAIESFVKEFEKMGYETTHNFNIEAWKKGKVDSSKFVIVMGHMDTVARTMGADDNASGAAGVLEIANALKDFESDYSILFMLTEDEEVGLVGAERYVRYLEKNGLKKDVLFVVNMDMIAYNSNGVVDLETEDQFEDLAKWMATLTTQYTALTPNIMLDAWASDHVPFIQAGIETLLTIEHWNTHTPCWHKACDTLDSINPTFGAEIVKLNLAATIEKAKVKIKP
ncbi:MAG: M28 family peptidase [Bdellovibrionota bacterium]